MSVGILTIRCSHCGDDMGSINVPDGLRAVGHELRSSSVSVPVGAAVALTLGANPAMFDAVKEPITQATERITKAFRLRCLNC